jgi:hypothetical protein
VEWNEPTDLIFVEMAQANLVHFVKRYSDRDITMHGFRATFKHATTNLTEHAWEVIEECFGHTVGYNTRVSP